MLLSQGVWAAKPARTTNPESYAQKATLNYGREQSDWGQAKVSACTQNMTSKGLNIFCVGTTRILGPGGGGDFMVDYQCQFLVTKESARTYLVLTAECE